MALTAKAIKGDPRAAVVVLNMINQLFGSDTELNDESSRLSSTDEEIIDAFLQGQLQAPATGEME
jgi:flagellar motor switch protein FliM